VKWKNGEASVGETVLLKARVKPPVRRGSLRVERRARKLSVGSGLNSGPGMAEPSR